MQAFPSAEVLQIHFDQVHESSEEQPDPTKEQPGTTEEAMVGGHIMHANSKCL